MLPFIPFGPRPMVMITPRERYVAGYVKGRRVGYMDCENNCPYADRGFTLYNTRNCLLIGFSVGYRYGYYKCLQDRREAQIARAMASRQYYSGSVSGGSAYSYNEPPPPYAAQETDLQTYAQPQAHVSHSTHRSASPAPTARARSRAMQNTERAKGSSWGRTPTDSRERLGREADDYRDPRRTAPTEMFGDDFPEQEYYAEEMDDTFEEDPRTFEKYREELQHMVDKQTKKLTAVLLGEVRITSARQNTTKSFELGTNYFSIVTIVNGPGAAPLTCVSFDATVGSWAILPLPSIEKNSIDKYILLAEGSSTHCSGEVKYKTDTGGVFKLLLECSAKGNKAWIEPTEYKNRYHIKANATGPLICTVIAHEVGHHAFESRSHSPWRGA